MRFGNMKLQRNVWGIYEVADAGYSERLLGVMTSETAARAWVDKERATLTEADYDLDFVVKPIPIIE